uniref:Uncharacterized protein n=1 Tax=Anguilla anguilla TaxID=7936 RepID=A0A0E9QCI6_ANGAN
MQHFHTGEKKKLLTVGGNWPPSSTELSPCNFHVLHPHSFL